MNILAQQKWTNRPTNASQAQTQTPSTTIKQANTQTTTMQHKKQSSHKVTQQEERIINYPTPNKKSNDGLRHTNSPQAKMDSVLGVTAVYGPGKMKQEVANPHKYSKG